MPALEPFGFVPMIDVPRAAGFVAVVVATWLAAGWARLAGRLRIGDARKINHAMVLVGGAAWFSDSMRRIDEASCIAAVVSLFLLILLACRFPRLGPFRYIFAGYARPEDAPHEALHVWVSWAAAIGGLLALELLAGPVVARQGALMLGVADALGEPIGSRFGRRWFHVPNLVRGRRARRSMEGSLAVACGAALVLTWCLPAEGVETAAAVLLGGLAMAGVEAASPHGLDNLTMPLGGAAYIWAAERLILA